MLEKKLAATSTRLFPSELAPRFARGPEGKKETTQNTLAHTRSASVCV